MNRYKVSLIRRDKSGEHTYIMCGTSIEDVTKKAKKYASAKVIIYIQLLKENIL